MYLLVVFVITMHKSVLFKPRHLSDSVYRFVRGGTVAVAVLSIRPWACYPVHGRFLIQYTDNLLLTLLYSYLCFAVLNLWAWDPTPTTLPPLYSHPDVARPLTCDNTPVSWGHRMHPATTGPGCFCSVFVWYRFDRLIDGLTDWNISMGPYFWLEALCFKRNNINSPLTHLFLDR